MWQLGDLGLVVGVKGQLLLIDTDRQMVQDQNKRKETKTKQNKRIQITPG